VKHQLGFQIVSEKFYTVDLIRTHKVMRASMKKQKAQSF